MNKVTVTYDVYNFDELSDKAKDKVKSKLSEVIIRDRFEWLGIDLAESLKASYDIDGEVFYSLGYSQGDGLHFNSDDLMTAKFYDLMLEVVERKVSSKEDKEVVKKVIKVFYDHRSNLQVYAKHDHRNRYEYASKNDINVEVLDEDAFKDLADIEAVKEWAGCKDGNAFKTAINILKNVVSLTYLKICNDFEVIGYKVYDVSDEDIKDLIESNDYVFHADGKVF